MRLATPLDPTRGTTAMGGLAALAGRARGGSLPQRLVLWLLFWPLLLALRCQPRSGAGTVNLIGSGRDTAQEGRSHEGLCPSGHAGDRGPGLKGLGPGGSIRAGGAVIAAEVEEIVDPVVGGEEALGLAG